MLLIGHRGARGEAPENTLGGFAYLHQLGVRAVEFDVHQLDDGSLVAFHDQSLLRLTGQDQPIWSLPAALRATLNVAQDWPGWPLEPLPCLHEVWPLLQDFTHIELELKPLRRPEQAPRLLETLARQLPDWPGVVLTSFDTNILLAARQYLPQVRRGLLIRTPGAVDDWLRQADGLDCQHLGLHYPLITAAGVQQLHRHGCWLSAWTVNAPQDIQQLEQWGIDGLITDFPARYLAATALPAGNLHE